MTLSEIIERCYEHPNLSPWHVREALRMLHSLAASGARPAESSRGRGGRDEVEKGEEMSRYPIPELTRSAASKLRGEVNALEFLLSVKSAAIAREQARMAELAVIVMDHGVELSHVFADNDVVEHIARCIRDHNKNDYLRHFPSGHLAREGDAK